MKVQKSELGPLIVQHAINRLQSYSYLHIFGSWSSELACGWVSVRIKCS